LRARRRAPANLTDRTYLVGRDARQPGVKQGSQLLHGLTCDRGEHNCRSGVGRLGLEPRTHGLKRTAGALRTLYLHGCQKVDHRQYAPVRTRPPRRSARTTARERMGATDSELQPKLQPFGADKRSPAAKYRTTPIPPSAPMSAKTRWTARSMRVRIARDASGESRCYGSEPADTAEPTSEPDRFWVGRHPGAPSLVAVGGSLRRRELLRWRKLARCSNSMIDIGLASVPALLRHTDLGR